jgi:hypothetical protein
MIEESQYMNTITFERIVEECVNKLKSQHRSSNRQHMEPTHKRHHTINHPPDHSVEDIPPSIWKGGGLWKASDDNNVSTIEVQGHIFKKGDRLGEGSDGEVYIYSLDTSSTSSTSSASSVSSITVKIPTTETLVLRGEIEIARHPCFNSSSLCDTIPIRVVEHPQRSIVAMPHMKGDLYTLFMEKQTKMNLLQIDAIIDQVRQSVFCLYRHGFYYVDIKLENVLYDEGKEHPKIILGDLGSVALDVYKPEASKNKICSRALVCTYVPPWVPTHKLNIIDRCYCRDSKYFKAIVEWCLDVMYFQILFGESFDNEDLDKNRSRLQNRLGRTCFHLL